MSIFVVVGMREFTRNKEHFDCAAHILFSHILLYFGDLLLKKFHGT